VFFNAVTNLQLRGIFSSGFDNYMITIRHVLSASNNQISANLLSGAIAASADYGYQYLAAEGTSVTASRFFGSNFPIGSTDVTARSGDTCFIYGPYLQQPTAMRTMNARGAGPASFIDWASTHNVANSYDGLSFGVSASNITGKVSVYGLVGK
jgi:hypothetical protein